MASIHDKLGALMELTVDELIRIIKEGDADAAVMQCARQIIKDQQIQVTPAVAEDFVELSERLKIHDGNMDEDDAATG